MSIMPADPVIAHIQQALPQFLQSRRWFRSKARTIASTRVLDIAVATGFPILMVAVEYTEGEPDIYLIPTARSAHAGEFDETIARLNTPDGVAVTVYSALSEPGFREALFHTLACGGSFPGQNGELTAEPSPFFQDACIKKLSVLDSFVSGAEQSNSSIIYGRQYILKLFRKLESGINPDVEIGRHLTTHGFVNTPATLGMLEYKSNGGLSYAAGILQKFVANRGDAWKYTLESLGEFFQRALAPGNSLSPALPSANPLVLMNEFTPAPAAQLIGPYLASAALLGQRTAEMHVALAASDHHDFKPEPFGPEESSALKANMLAQAHTTFHLLRLKQSDLNAADSIDAIALLSLETDVIERLESLHSEAVTALRIRHHGDYHLGQILYTGSDFMIIDFEGEPALPLSERRSKALALKDVAGMLRSFQYAAYAALFGLVPGVPTDSASRPLIQAWASFWNGWVGAEYLKSYITHAQGHVFASGSDAETRSLLNAFVLQKALYEVAYELNNRPAWVGIPIRGILSLIE